jgi:hypothetical protein
MWGQPASGCPGERKLACGAAGLAPPDGRGLLSSHEFGTQPESI